MSTPDSTGTSRNGNVKTLAIRLEPDLHSQLSMLAQLRGNTITDEIRSAIDNHIAVLKADPELAAQAEGVLASIEREAAARRAAIATLFEAPAPAEPTPVPTGDGAPEPPAEPAAPDAPSTGAKGRGRPRGTTGAKGHDPR